LSQPVGAHASTHQSGQSDALSGTLAVDITGNAATATSASSASAAPWSGITGKPSTFTPSAHASTHQSGQSDALAGTLAVDISGNAATATSATSAASVPWSGVTGKPSTFAPSSHQHAAGDVISGVLTTSRLGTGTPSNANFLRGDGAWTSLQWSDVSGGINYASGNVGIGTTSPGYKLDVNGTFHASDVSTFGGNVIFSTDNAYDIGASGANRPRNLYVAGTGAFGGKLSIGASSANNALSVNGNADFGATSYAYAGQSQFGALTFPRGQLLFSNSNAQNQLYLASNAYMNSSANWNYRNAATAVVLGLDLGGVYVYTAASGTKDATIAWNAGLTVTNDPRVGILTNSPTAALDVNSNVIRLRTAKTPATSDAACNAGDICWDSTYLYVCTATNTWRRVAHASW
jgi:hypothetical protein